MTDREYAEYKAASTDPMTLAGVLGVGPQYVARRKNAHVSLDYLREVFDPTKYRWLSRDCGIVVPFLLNAKAVCTRCYRATQKSGICDISHGALVEHIGTDVHESKDDAAIQPTLPQAVQNQVDGLVSKQLTTTLVVAQ